MVRPAGMFICSHHRCCSCNRFTASAGGLLFRCTGCLTAYCEDCLPQDEIDSVGRCRKLEQLGYNSRQSYYIRCPYCCQLDGFKPQGMLQENADTEAAAKAAKLKAAEDAQQLLLSPIEVVAAPRSTRAAASTHLAASLAREILLSMRKK